MFTYINSCKTIFSPFPYFYHVNHCGYHTLAFCKVSPSPVELSVKDSLIPHVCFRQAEVNANLTTALLWAKQLRA